MLDYIVYSNTIIHSGPVIDQNPTNQMKQYEIQKQFLYRTFCAAKPEYAFICGKDAWEFATSFNFITEINDFGVDF